MSYYSYHHIHLISPDPIRTAQFYENMFNADRVSTRELPDGRVSIELSLNGSIILLMQRPVQVEATPASDIAINGLDHFGIITDNLETAIADLKAKGVKFRDEMREARPGLKIAFLWGPENVLIELLEGW